MVINGKFRCPGCMEELHNENDFCKCGIDLSQGDKSYGLTPIGTVIEDNYIIGNVVDKYAYYVSYVGWDTKQDKKIFVFEYIHRGKKKVSSEETDDVDELYSKGKKRFLDESKILEKFKDCEGIIHIENTIVTKDRYYSVSDYFEGDTLEEYIKKRRKISLEEVMKIFSPIVSFLSILHEDVGAHGGIIPNIILVDSKGQGMLLDIGLKAYFEEISRDYRAILINNLDPIECVKSRGIKGIWTDVYFLCASIYWAVTGKIPCHSIEVFSGTDKLIPPHELAPEYDAEFSNIIMKGMEVKAEDRYQSVTELWSLLQSYIANRDSKPNHTNIEKAEHISFMQKCKMLVSNLLVK